MKRTEQGDRVGPGEQWEGSYIVHESDDAKQVIIFHLHGVFQTLRLHAPAEFTERYEQVCSPDNGTQAEEDAVIIFATLGQMVYHAWKSLPAEATQPDSCLGTDLGQQETETASELGVESGQLSCWSYLGEEGQRFHPLKGH